MKQKLITELLEKIETFCHLCQGPGMRCADQDWMWDPVDFEHLL